MNQITAENGNGLVTQVGEPIIIEAISTVVRRIKLSVSDSERGWSVSDRRVAHITVSDEELIHVD